METYYECPKVNLIKETILNDHIDILCMQETEMNCNIDHSILSFPGFYIETEKNSCNSRTAIYISNNLQYLTREELEGEDLCSIAHRFPYQCYRGMLTLGIYLIAQKVIQVPFIG